MRPSPQFKSWTLWLNHTEQWRKRKAQQNEDEKSLTSMLLQLQKGIYAIAQPIGLFGGGAGIWPACGPTGAQYERNFLSGSSAKSFAPDAADRSFHLRNQ